MDYFVLSSHIQSHKIHQWLWIEMNHNSPPPFILSFFLLWKNKKKGLLFFHTFQFMHFLETERNILASTRKVHKKRVYKLPNLTISLQKFMRIHKSFTVSNKIKVKTNNKQEKNTERDRRDAFHGPTVPSCGETSFSCKSFLISDLIATAAWRLSDQRSHHLTTQKCSDWAVRWCKEIDELIGGDTQWEHVAPGSRLVWPPLLLYLNWIWHAAPEGFRL